VGQLLGRRPRFSISKEISANPSRGTDLSTYLESIKRFMLRVRRARRKVVIFHEEDSKVLDCVVEYSRSIWGAVRVDYIRIDNQRKVGPRGDVTYIVLKSPYRRKLGNITKAVETKIFRQLSAQQDRFPFLYAVTFISYLTSHLRGAPMGCTKSVLGITKDRSSSSKPRALLSIKGKNDIIREGYSASWG
jgi:hypothetical protein